MSTQIQNNLQCRKVRFLSQNPPGARMGMGHYERLLLKHLHAAAGGAEWSFEMVFDGRRKGQKLDHDSTGLSFTSFAGLSSSRFSRAPWWLTRAASRVLYGRQRPDLYHSLALSLPIPADRPALYTIHDLPPARFPDEGTVPRWAQDAACAARGIVTPSEFARRELIELLGVAPERVHVVPYGCEHDRFHPAVASAKADVLARYGLRRPFVAYAGGFTRRKNVAALLAAWRQIAPRFPDLQLALIGPEAQLQEHAAAAGAPRVQVVGYLGRDELPGVIKAAEFLVCPSIYEGFGLPPLEAMALGVPVVAVKAGAIPEVTDGHACLSDDGSAEGIADAMSRVLGDAALARQLASGGPRRAQAFCWRRHAEQMLELYRTTAAV
jgi:glycosyltransferase involved in cell wall biosynthesis